MPLDYALWLVEFIIEAAILAVAFRKSLFPLSAYAASRVIFDVITFASLFIGNFYDLAFWIVKPLEYFFQIVLTVTCIGFMVKESRMYVRLLSIVLSMLATMGVMLAYGMAPLRYSRMLDIEMSLNLFLAIGLFVALMSGFPERAWKRVAYGLIILGCSDSILGVLAANFKGHWDLVARMYPLCEIAALGTLLWAARGVVLCCSASLGHEVKDAQNVSVC